MSKIISYPNLAGYQVPVKILLKNLLPDCEIRPSPPTTFKTLEIGSKYSPDFVCLPFKYNLGNLIESLDGGANVIMQAGGGCRYGYYGELQDLILKDLGYDFEYLNLFGAEVMSIPRVYKTLKGFNPKLKLSKFAYFALMTIKLIKKLDEFDVFVRSNIGFEINKGSYEKIMKGLYEKIKDIKGFKSLNKCLNDTQRELNAVQIDKPKNCLRVGMVGELYTLMEAFSNYFMEKELAKYNISITRFTNLTYLLFKKTRLERKLLREAKGYLQYAIGADGTDSVSRTRMLSEEGYDGIIHLKPFGCTPEVNAMPMLQNISMDYKIPVLYFSFDSQTSETGIQTRLEAFYDMLSARKKSEQSVLFA